MKSESWSVNWSVLLGFKYLNWVLGTGGREGGGGGVADFGSGRCRVRGNYTGAEESGSGDNDEADESNHAGGLRSGSSEW